jgi:hypothetical protein
MIKSISESLKGNKHSLSKSMKESLIFLLVAFLIGLLVGLSIRDEPVLPSEYSFIEGSSFVGKPYAGEVEK